MAEKFIVIGGVANRVDQAIDQPLAPQDLGEGPVPVPLGGDVAAHAARAGPAARHIVERNTGGIEQGGGAVGGAHPDTHPLSRHRRQERQGLGFIVARMHVIARVAARQITGGKAQGAPRGDEDEAAQGVGFPSEIARAFDEILIALAGIHQGVAQAAIER